MNLPNEYLLLIDASSFIHRHYHAAARLERRRDGLEVGALLAFTWSMMKMTLYAERTTLKVNPSHAAMIMDARGRNFRHDIYPAYKANRQAYEDALEAQIPYIEPMAAALGIPVVKVPGFEADDLIATYSHAAEREGMFCVIASSDKDLMQMITPTTVIYDPKKDGGREYPYHLLTSADCLETWGVAPWQMPDLQALTGDLVDNVPGIAGIGPKTAAKLLQEFLTLDGVFDNIDFIEMRGAAKIMERLREGEPLARLSRELVELRRHAPGPFSIDELRLMQFDHRKAVDWLLDMEFTHLARKLDQYAGQ